MPTHTYNVGRYANVADLIAKHFKVSTARIEKAIGRAFFLAATRGRALLIARSPVGVTGQYRQGWQMPTVLPDGSVEIINSAPHAVLVELGSRPHMPPVEPIILWVQRKLGYPPKEARRIGWAVAMHIKKHGTRPQHVMLGAKPELEQILLQEIEIAVAHATRE